MFKAQAYEGNAKDQSKLLIKQLKSLLEGEPNIIANLSNSSALLNQFLERINWVGFYLVENNQLVLGPFQGLPACIRIPFEKGVCGTAAATEKTIVVEDVNAFPGHIACDAASQSEIVIPIFKNGELFGVLDIDSPEKNRFDHTEQAILEEFVRVLESFL